MNDEIEEFNMKGSWQADEKQSLAAETRRHEKDEEREG
jgi:hypothetical protein